MATSTPKMPPSPPPSSSPIEDDSNRSLSATLTTTSIPDTTEPSKPSTLEQTIRSRHSIRYFLPTPIPTPLLHHCLTLAQQAPSNSNTQPWRLYLASGSTAHRFRTALMAEATVHGPKIGPLPEAFMHFRSAFGKQLYGPDGYDIAREDVEARRKATLRNYEFFGAPTVGIVCMDKRLMGTVDAIGVGMWLQTLMLVLTERGLGSCVEQSLAGYPEVCRRVLGIGEELEVCCGIAMGWPDERERVNGVVAGRGRFEECVTFVGEEGGEEVGM